MVLTKEMKLQQWEVLEQCSGLDDIAWIQKEVDMRKKSIWSKIPRPPRKSFSEFFSG